MEKYIKTSENPKLNDLLLETLVYNKELSFSPTKMPFLKE